MTGMLCLAPKSCRKSCLSANGRMKTPTKPTKSPVAKAVTPAAGAAGAGAAAAGAGAAAEECQTVTVRENNEGGSLEVCGGVDQSWKREFTVTILEKPVPQKQRGHNGSNFFDGSASAKKRLQAALRAEAAKLGITELMTGPLRLDGTFYFDKSVAEKKGGDAGKIMPHAKRPDLDNLIKFFGDAAKGILVADDCQFYAFHVDKVKRAGVPKTFMMVREMVEDNTLM